MECVRAAEPPAHTPITPYFENGLEGASKIEEGV